MQLLTLKEAAKEAGLSPLEFVIYAQQNNIKSIVKDQKPMYEAKIIESNPKIIEHNPEIIKSNPYDYEAKNIWRQTWMNFVSNSLTINQQTKVLCLGGYGNEIPLYVEKGIQQSNITVVEGNNEWSQHIHQLYPGVDVQNKDLLSYLETTPLKFESILLDYDGRLGSSLNHIETIIRRELLHEHSCFGVNYFGARENEKEQALLQKPLFVETQEVLLDRGEQLQSELKTFEQESTYSLRDFGITATVLQMLSGRDSFSINKALRILPSDERRFLKRHFATKNPTTYKDFLENNYNLRRWLHDSFSAKEVPHEFSLIAFAYHAKPYFIEDLKRLKYYNGRGNTPFLSDFYHLEKRDDIFACIRESSLQRFIDGKSSIDAFKIWYNRLEKRERKEFDARALNANRFLTHEYSRFLTANDLPERILLGAHDLSTEEIKEAHTLFSLNKSNDDIMKLHPAWRRNSLNGVKAQYTRKNQRA